MAHLHVRFREGRAVNKKKIMSTTREQYVYDFIPLSNILGITIHSCNKLMTAN